MNIAEALKDASEVLHNSGVAQPRAEAATLLAFSLRRDKTFLISHPEYRLGDDEIARFFENLRRRASREPYQYITGHQEFYGLDFEVTPDVLIPRPETEILVETALDVLERKDSPRFCEIGVGSGCISIAILHEHTSAIGVGLDVSEKALQIARRNAEKHGVMERLHLRKSDVFSEAKGERFDLIISNPPYVPTSDLESLQAEVRDFEPHIALAGGADGLDIVRKVIIDSPNYLKEDGHLIIEFGFGQANDVGNLFDPKIWETIDFFPDLQGIPRILKAQKREH